MFRSLVCKLRNGSKYSINNTPETKIKINKRAIIGINLLGIVFVFYQYNNIFEKEKKIFEKFIEENQIELFDNSLKIGLDCIKNTQHNEIINNLFGFEKQKNLQILHTSKIFSDHLISIKMNQFILPTICDLEMNQNENKLITTNCSKPLKFEKKNIDFYFPIGNIEENKKKIFILKVGLESQKKGNLTLSPDKNSPELFVSKISICDPKSIDGVNILK